MLLAYYLHVLFRSQGISGDKDAARPSLVESHQTIIQEAADTRVQELAQELEHARSELEVRGYGVECGIHRCLSHD